MYLKALGKQEQTTQNQQRGRDRVESEHNEMGSIKSRVGSLKR